jgi:hypothetical protein
MPEDSDPPVLNVFSIVHVLTSILLNERSRIIPVSLFFSRLVFVGLLFRTTTVLQYENEVSLLCSLYLASLDVLRSEVCPLH